MLSLSELRKINTKVTAILFPKKDYQFEGIIRWIYDRGFRFEDFEETENFYSINQPCKAEFKYFEYKKLVASNIIIEIGTMNKNENNRGVELLTSTP